MLHLCFGESTKGMLKYELRAKQEPETVCCLPLQLFWGNISDALNTDTRLDVYERTAPEFSEQVRRYTDEWKREIKRHRRVCIWYSSAHAEELTGMYHAIASQKEKELLLVDCALPLSTAEGMEIRYQHTEEIPAEELGLFLAEAKQLTDEEKAEYVREWDRLVGDAATLRILEDAGILSVDESYYDALLEKYITKEPVTAARVIGNAILEEDKISEEFLVYRIEKLVAGGKFRVVGWADDFYCTRIAVR